MSYDFEIYGTSKANDPVGSALADFPGLRVLERGNDGIRVGRGARGVYAFTVEGPYDVEREDVPPEVTRILVAPEVRFDLLLEGGIESPPQLKEATRFARSIAAYMTGAVLDKQLDQTWSTRGIRQAAKPAIDEEVDLLELDWYLNSDQLSEEAIQSVLDILSRFLPEAMPRRYGGYEPLKGKFDSGGAYQLIRTWKETRNTIYFSSAPPVVGGSFDTPVGSRNPFIANITLHLLGTVFADPQWRDLISFVFQEVAQATHAFYGTARLTHGWHWNGRTVYSSHWTGDEPSSAARGLWWGLFPHPVWLQWFSGPYRRYVEGRLPIGSVRVDASGILNRLSDEILARRELERLVASSSTDFVPAELRSAVDPVTVGMPGHPEYGPAEVIPPELESFRPQTR